MNMANTIRHTIFITIHSLVYTLGYCEAIALIILGYHRAITLPFLHYQCMNYYAYKYLYICLYIIFLLLMLVLVIHISSTMFLTI